MSGSMVTATVSETGSVTEIAEAMTAPAGSMAGMQTTEAPTESENGSMTRGGALTHTTVQNMVTMVTSIMAAGDTTTQTQDETIKEDAIDLPKLTCKSAGGLPNMHR